VRESGRAGPHALRYWRGGLTVEVHVDESGRADDITMGGDAGPADREHIDGLLDVLYTDLRSLARHHMQRERRDHTLQATAIVHEVYLKLIDQRKTDWANRTQFFALASHLIRRILVDHARQAKAAKRGGGWERLTVAEVCAVAPEQDVDLLALDDAMGKLASIDERLARIVELRFFGGLTLEEAASIMDVSERTAKRLWASAKAWLYRELESGDGDGGDANG